MSDTVKWIVLGLGMCLAALAVIGWTLQANLPLWLALPIVFLMLVVGAFGTIFLFLGLFE